MLVCLAFVRDKAPFTLPNALVTSSVSSRAFHDFKFFFVAYLGCP